MWKYKEFFFFHQRGLNKLLVTLFLVTPIKTENSFIAWTRRKNQLDFIDNIKRWNLMMVFAFQKKQVKKVLFVLSLDCIYIFLLASWTIGSGYIIDKKKSL